MNAIPDKYFEDFNVGDKFTTGERLVTREQIATFAELSGDFNAIHTDEEYAKNNTPYGGIIAHGGLIYSMGTGMFITSEAGAPGLFLGLRQDFKNATKPGDRIHLEIEVLSKRLTSRGDRGIVEYAVNTVNQDGVLLIEAVWKIMLDCKKTK